MGGTQRVWAQPAHIVVREGWLRTLYGIGDDVRLEDLDPQELDDMVGEAILYAPEHHVEFDEGWREVEPEPYPDSGHCRCGHWLRLDSDWGEGETSRPCRAACDCKAPERQPDPPWVRHEEPAGSAPPATSTQ
jgi:hypothetical protein